MRRLRLILAMTAAAAFCTWEGSKKTQDCGNCSCVTCTGIVTTHAEPNENGRCSSCGEQV